MTDEAGPAGVSSALRRLAVAMRCKTLAAEDEDLFIREALSALGGMPARFLDEAVSRFIRGEAGSGPWAPTINELCCEARRLAEEGGTPVEKNGQYQVFVEVGTAEWTAWDAYWRATHRKSPPSVNMLAHGGRRGWLFPSPRPPRAEVAS